MVWFVRADYYQELKSIEKNALNDLSGTKEKLSKIAQHKNEFTQDEQYLYQIVKAHAEALNTNYEKSEALLLQVIESDADTNFKGRAYSLIASTKMIHGQYVESYYYLDKSLSLLDRMDDRSYKVKILSNALNNYNDLEMLDYAMVHARRLLKLGEQENDPVAICMAMFEMALIELNAGKENLAEKRVKKIHSLCDQEIGVLVLHSITSFEAKIALAKNNTEDAKKILEQRYPEVKSFGWEILTAIFEIDLADVYLRNEQYEKAEKFALMGLERARKNRDIKREKNVIRLLAELSTKLNKKSEALEYYQKYIQLEQKLSSSVRQRKLAYGQARQRLREERLAKLEDAN